MLVKFIKGLTHAQFSCIGGVKTWALAMVPQWNGSSDSSND